MKAHNPELISALLDGELKGLRRWFVQHHVDRCEACATEYRELQQVRQMLAANPVAHQMSDSQDFFWSKVKRGIQTQEGKTEAIPVPQLSLTDWLGQRRYAFASVAVAVVAVIGVTLALNTNQPAENHVVTVVAKAPLATVEHVVTALPNTAATAFEAKDADATVIWVSGLPWTKDMTEMQTLFASLDS